MLIHIPDILTTAEAAELRLCLEKADWRDGAATAGHLAARVKTNLQLSDSDPLAGQLAQSIAGRLERIPRFIAAALPMKMVPPRFNQYRAGGAYGNHIDNAIFSLPQTRERVRSDLSVTLFLSEPDSYEGGELVLESGVTPERVKLPAGHLILYPSDMVHRVTPVTRGARIAAFFWVQSLVREQSRRTLLLELDNSIQALAADMPDHPQIVRLTGLYHNLLRQWADT